MFIADKKFFIKASFLSVFLISVFFSFSSEDQILNSFRRAKDVFLDDKVQLVLELINYSEKDKLKELIAEDPSIVKRVIRYINKQRKELGNSALDLLLGLDNVAAVESKVDLDALPSEYGSEQYEYEPTPYYKLRKVVQYLNLGPKDVFYDLGAGYGRVVLYLTLATDVGKAVGIEITPQRYRESNKAAKTLGLDNVEFINANVKDVDMSDGTVFFLFNPFSEETLESITDKLRTIASRKKITIVCWGSSQIHLNFHNNWLKMLQSIGPEGRNSSIEIYESTLH